MHSVFKQSKTSQTKGKADSNPKNILKEQKKKKLKTAANKAKVTSWNLKKTF